MIAARPVASTNADANSPYARAAYLRVEDAMALLGVGRDTIWHAIRKGRLRAARIGNKLLIRPEDLDAYVEASTVRAGGDD